MKKFYRKGKKLRISINVGFFDEKKQKPYNLSSFTKKTSAVAMAQVRIQKKGHVYLRIKYNSYDYNDGVYHNLQDFKLALRQFTEKNLLDLLN